MAKIEVENVYKIFGNNPLSVLPRAQAGEGKDQILANISLYWFTGAINASFWPYYARMHRPWPIPTGVVTSIHLSRPEMAIICT